MPAICWRHVDSGAVLLRSATTFFRRYGGISAVEPNKSSVRHILPVILNVTKIEQTKCLIIQIFQNSN